MVVPRYERRVALVSLYNQWLDDPGAWKTKRGIYGNDCLYASRVINRSGGLPVDNNADIDGAGTSSGNPLGKPKLNVPASLLKSRYLPSPIAGVLMLKHRKHYGPTRMNNDPIARR